MAVSDILATELWCVGCRRHRSILRFGARSTISSKTGANKLCRECDSASARDRMRQHRAA
jgi:hypothetical protein